MDGPSAVELVARTVRVDALDSGSAPTSFSSPKRSLRGHGVAAVIELPAPWPDHIDLVEKVLATIDIDDEVRLPGSGPVAFGALPFDRRAPATLLVPAVILGTTADGERWRTTIAGCDTTPLSAPLTAPARAVDRPRSITVTSTQDAADWCAIVESARARIAAGALRKVVLARCLEVTADQPFDPTVIAERLAAAHPAALRYCIDGFVGASPELLVSRIGDQVRAQPMAGTTPRSGDPTRDARRAAELMLSEKNRVEYQITIDAVHDALLGWCSYLDAEPQPSVVHAGSVQHLATLVEGRLSHPIPNVLELVAALHPTPAVGGSPDASAIALIGELESVSRGRYAGPVGWVDSQGNGAWAVGLRSAQIIGRTATLFAGVGVVADSDPLAELAETEAKFAATLPHLVTL